MPQTRQRPFVCSLLFCVWLCTTSPGLAQSAAFTYQGKLTDAGNPANGPYDLQFRLLDALVGGNPVGAPLVREDVTVTNGIFTVTLDFGAAAFPGANRWLEIAVRPGASTGAFTTLSPLQPLTSTPYAIQSLNATNATNAVNFSGALAGDVTGTQGATTVAKLRGQLVGSTVPTAGQVLKFNGTTNQWEPAADNNSGGTLMGVTAGTGLSGGGASGNVTLNIANSGVGTTQLADNGVTDAKIVSVSGGKITGAVANATNATNSTNATNATTSVNFSAALGGDVTGNQTATSVVKLRNVSLPAPVLADHGKVLKYKNNGVDPITFEWATDNTVAGGVTSVTASAPLASSGGATPNLSLTGVVAAANGGTGLSAVGAAGNLLRSNGAAWTSAALQAADVPDLGASYLKNSMTQQASSNFNISGNGTAGGTLSGAIVNTGSRYNLNGLPILSSPGSFNLFVGGGAGIDNTSGGSNSFFGSGAGSENTNGNQNSFFGASAGADNKGGSNNSFFGESAGAYNNTGTFNSFFGQGAGYSNTSGQDNSFFGRSAGYNNVGGGANAFFGLSAGFNNISGGSNSFFGVQAGRDNNFGTENSFFGRAAGQSNTSGVSNSFFGLNAGNTNTGGNYNTIIGREADVGSGNLNNATAIGNRAFVEANDTLVLGSTSGVNGAGDDTHVVIGATGSGSGSNNSRAARLNVFGGEPWTSNLWRAAVKIQTAGAIGWDGGATHFGIGQTTGGLYFFRTVDYIGTQTVNPAIYDLIIDDTGLARFGRNCVANAAGSAIAGACSSDARLKRDITPFPRLLEKVVQLRPVHYYWRSAEFPARAFGPEQAFGLIAQEAEAVLPELVGEDAEGYKTVNYTKLPLLLLQAVKDLKAENDTLKEQHAATAARLAALEQMLRQLMEQTQKAAQPKRP